MVEITWMIDEDNEMEQIVVNNECLAHGNFWDVEGNIVIKAIKKFCEMLNIEYKVTMIHGPVDY